MYQLIISWKGLEDSHEESKWVRKIKSRRLGDTTRKSIEV